MKTLALSVSVSLLMLAGLNAAKAAPKSVSQGFSETQVDGVTSAVVDNLWECTDYWWHRGEYPRIIALDRLITEADQHFLLPYSTGGWLMESDGDNPDAEKYYRLGCDRNSNKSFMWFTLGFFYFSTEKDYPSAIDSFTSATNAPDAGINSWKMLAHSYERNGQLDRAVQVWLRLQQTYPTDGVIAHNLDKDQKKLLAMATPAGQ